MSDRPTDQPDEDDLDPTSTDEAPDEGDFEDDEPTYEEDDDVLRAAAEEAPLSSIAAIGGLEEPSEQMRPMRPSERRAMRAAMEHGQIAAEPGHSVSDRASAVFVLVTVGVFVLIMLNGMLLGHGGLLTPVPTPSPVPSLTASPAPSPTDTPAAATPTAAPSVTPAPSASPAATSEPSATPAAS